MGEQGLALRLTKIGQVALFVLCGIMIGVCNLSFGNFEVEFIEQDYSLRVYSMLKELASYKGC